MHLNNLYFLFCVQEWKQDDLCDDLKMPLKNEFIATDLSLVAVDNSVVITFISA